jgi:hypothetical protein
MFAIAPDKFLKISSALSGRLREQKRCPTQRAPDWWESARFQAGALNWFHVGVVSSPQPRQPAA